MTSLVDVQYDVDQSSTLPHALNRFNTTIVVSTPWYLPHGVNRPNASRSFPAFAVSARNWCQATRCCLRHPARVLDYYVKKVSKCKRFFWISPGLPRRSVPPWTALYRTCFLRGIPRRLQKSVEVAYSPAQAQGAPNQRSPFEYHPIHSRSGCCLYCSLHSLHHNSGSKARAGRGWCRASPLSSWEKCSTQVTACKLTAAAAPQSCRYDH